MAATHACTGMVREWLTAETPLWPCSWHQGPGGDATALGEGAVRFPPEYQAWLAERFRQGRVAPAPSNGARIRLPVSGSVFHFNPTLPPESQAIRIETAGFGPGALVLANDVPQGSLNHAGVFAMPLRRGLHRIAVEDENGYDIVEITVR